MILALENNARKTKGSTILFGRCYLFSSHVTLLQPKHVELLLQNLYKISLFQKIKKKLSKLIYHQP